MKTIGLLGGMSWESTISYYQYLNRYAQQQYGGLSSAPIVLYSVDFSPLERLQHENNWQAITDILIMGARQVEAGGADCLLICTNTMHKVADEIAEAIDIPLVHIADAVAEKLLENQTTTAGLLGTMFTMQEDFYSKRLEQKYGIKVLTPTPKQQQSVHDIIYNELCQGKVSDTSRKQYVDIIDSLSSQGAEGIILGCTEIPLLVQQTHTTIALYDTVAIHANSAAQQFLKL